MAWTFGNLLSSAPASCTSCSTIWAAGLMSWTALTECPAHIGASSGSPSKSGGIMPTAYRGHS